MEEKRLDEFAKKLAGNVSRKGLLKGFFATAVGGVLMRLDTGSSFASRRGLDTTAKGSSKRTGSVSKKDLSGLYETNITNGYCLGLNAECNRTDLPNHTPDDGWRSEQTEGNNCCPGLVCSHPDNRGVCVCDNTCPANATSVTSFYGSYMRYSFYGNPCECVCNPGYEPYYTYSSDGNVLHCAPIPSGNGGG